MATGAMLWGGGSYNNGIVPFKRYILGEAYTREGKPAAIQGRFQVTREHSDRFGLICARAGCGTVTSRPTYELVATQITVCPVAWPRSSGRLRNERSSAAVVTSGHCADV